MTMFSMKDRLAEMAMMRDSQRQRCYDAEDDVTPGRLLETLDDCRAYIDRIRRNGHARRRFPHQPKEIHLVRARSKNRAHAAMNIITIPKSMQTEMVLLHELAHVLTLFERTETHPARARAGMFGHGFRFCQNYIFLVSLARGPAAAGALRAAFRTHKVRTSAKREMTEAQKAALRQRLKAYQNPEQLAAARAARRKK